MAAILLTSGPAHLRRKLLERSLPPVTVRGVQCVSALYQQSYAVSVKNTSESIT